MNTRIFVVILLFFSLLLPWFFDAKDLAPIEVYLISTIKIAVLGLLLILLILLISWIFDQAKETVIFPFNNATGDDEYNGTALSESLIVELQRIIRIHSETRPEMNIESLPYSLKIQFEKLKMNIPDDLRSQSQSLASNISTLGIMSFGGNRIDIGSVIVSIKRLLPSSFRGGYISGCVQRFGSSTRLSANIEYNGKIYAVENTRDNFKAPLLPIMIKDLAFNILFNLTIWNKTPYNIINKINYKFLKRIKIIKETYSPETIRANSWKAFKYFTETLDSYNRYYYSNNEKDLNMARFYCEQTAKIQTNFPILSVLFTYLGLSYYKLEKYSDAIKMFEQALRIEDPQDIHSQDIRCLLGLTYRYLHRFRDV